jgi:hypothetical protein
MESAQKSLLRERARQVNDTQRKLWLAKVKGDPHKRQKEKSK